jgi:hypothetical protein
VVSSQSLSNGNSQSEYFEDKYDLKETILGQGCSSLVKLCQLKESYLRRPLAAAPQIAENATNSHKHSLFCNMKKTGKI